MTDAMLRADSVGKRFGERAVLTAASLDVHRGKIIALMGRNGAGKSTLLKMCAGLLAPDHGNVWFQGEQIRKLRFHEMARRGLAYLPSERNLFSTTHPLRAQFEAIVRNRQHGSVVEVVDMLELGHCVNQLPVSLSGGEQRRASVAVTWLLAPQCLLADEPLRGIDPKDQERIMEVYRSMARSGCGIVVTGHQADYLMHEADVVVWVTAGTTHNLGSAHAARQHWQFRREFLGIRGSVA